MEWALIGFQLLGGVLANRNYTALPTLEGFPASLDGDLGHVSIVVPARDEAARIGPLLQSLAALRYPSYEVTVVDDGSTDGTGTVAARHGACVLRVSGPPPGWTGKAYACQVGADRTRGEWLLFTDADTVHGPGSLRLAVAAATRSGASLVSLLARQECRTFWEKLLLPYAYALYFVGASNANRPGGPAIANGQYMLFRRTSYQSLGGHAAVRGSIVEDVSLAKVVRSHGQNVLLLRGEEHLSVRMYGSLRELWEGFSKNAFRFVSSSPRAGLRTVLGTIAFNAALPVAMRARSGPARLGLLLAPALGLLSWQRRFGVSRWHALLYPLAGGVFQAIALHSLWRALSGQGAVWKGRRY